MPADGDRERKGCRRTALSLSSGADAGLAWPLARDRLVRRTLTMDSSERLSRLPDLFGGFGDQRPREHLGLIDELGQ